MKGGRMDMYVVSKLTRMEGVTNRWTRAQLDRKVVRVGQVCTIRKVEPAVVAVVSNTYTLRDKEMPEIIEEVLQE